MERKTREGWETKVELQAARNNNILNINLPANPPETCQAF